MVLRKACTQKQKGFASTLVVLLVGFALAGSLMGTAYYLNSSQKSLLANHALTNVQSGAWTGVEILRQYLHSLPDEDLVKLKDSYINLNSFEASQLRFKRVNTVVISQDDRIYEVTALIENKSERSEASSRIAVTYRLNRGQQVPSQQVTTDIAVVNIYGDLKVTGRVDIVGGKKAIINVQGNVVTQGNSFSGVEELLVTGNVHLRGGGESIKKIVSNGNVIMDSGVADEVYAKGDITINNGRQVGNLYADGDIIITNGSVNVANALGSITMRGAASQKLIAGKDVTITNGQNADVFAKGLVTLGGGSKLGTVKSLGGIRFTTNSISQAGDLISNGDIDFGNSGLSIGDAISAGKVTCVATWWANYKSLRAGKGFVNCATKNRVVLASDYFPLVVADIPVTGSDVEAPITQKTAIDAYIYKLDANYLFSYDTSKSNIKVTLQNIEDPNFNGKTFYMGSYPNSWNDWGYLCSDVSNNTCKDVPVAKITQASGGNGDAKKLINYTNGTWELRGFGAGSLSKNPPEFPALSAGILFFEGNVKMYEGKFVNSIIATKNITFTGAGTSVYAPNYVERSYICNKTNYPNTTYKYLKPSNLCGTSTVKIANTALLAGSFVRNGGVKSDVYQGGDITLATSYIYGNVVAGNRFYTNNTVYISGTLDAENLLNPNVATDLSSIFDSVIDLTDTETTETTSDNEAGGSSAETVDSEPVVKWAKYS